MSQPTSQSAPDAMPSIDLEGFLEYSARSELRDLARIVGFERAREIMADELTQIAAGERRKSC